MKTFKTHIPKKTYERIQNETTKEYNETKPSISVVIPAYNESKTIGGIVEQSLRYVDEVVVVDDGSTDGTGEIAGELGAIVLRNEPNRGVLASLRRGLRSAHGDIVVTLDADGQHDPSEIPALLEPILNDMADLVLGSRPELPYFSERVLAFLTSLKVNVNDASTGFRVMRRGIAESLEIHGTCACGTLVLEALSLGARISQVPISIRERLDGDRRIQTRHFVQALYVIYELIRYSL